MKHLIRLAIIVLLCLCLYFSLVNNAVALDRLSSNAKGLFGGQHAQAQLAELKSDGINDIPGDWEVLLNETFEEAWPSSGWSVIDLNSDGDDRKWGSDDYRPHPPSLKAAWPARSGRNGRNPTSKNNDYFNTMDTRMIYGPFDLSDASTLEINFWMWWQTEENRDYLILEISRDNLTFTELGRWQGSSGGWQLIDISTNDYAQDSSVWVAWRFTSNASNVFDGPWVDDILLSKNLSQFVNVRGTLSYYNRYGNLAGAAYTTAYLYDHDFGGDGDDLLRTVYTEANGSFDFGQVYNIDDDDPDDPIDQLDLYVVWKTFYNDSDIAHHQVENFDDQIYQWQSNVFYNVSDPTININKTIPLEDLVLRAMWIFQDLRKAWEYFYSNTIPSYDPGNVTIKWELNENELTPCSGPCFYGFGPYVFIADQSTISIDTIIHEVGHNYMYNATGWWLWWDIDCFNHNIYSIKDQYCAWSEGWADFYPLAVNDDPCYDFDIGPCTGMPDERYYNLETHSRDDLWPFPWGDSVEGRVAGSFYDLFDFNWPIEGYDDAYFNFEPIANIIVNGGEETYSDFWNNWKSFNYETHHAVRAIFQNTIDYNTPPYFDQPLPLLYGLENNPIHHAIDLWLYSIDEESSLADLTYSINGYSGCDFYVTDDRWIDVYPWQGWLGECWANVEINDSISTNYSALSVLINPVVGIAYLPIVIK